MSQGQCAHFFRLIFKFKRELQLVLSSPMTKTSTLFLKLKINPKYGITKAPSLGTYKFLHVSKMVELCLRWVSPLFFGLIFKLKPELQLVVMSSTSSSLGLNLKIDPK